ncbi:MAG: NINE protein [Chroococcidiopsidaceae cyanobacterium CP_BM_ER_R8_30]|nr:NINE protein [Chroococcidiopsidaceae cyanobacterium CP_BM_ER_R8_30]
MLSRPKSRNVAAILALVGILIPISGLHKFYLGQPLWGVLYILLSLTTPIPRVASAIEAVWYLAQDQDEFDQNFNLNLELPKKSSAVPVQVNAIAEAMRQLDTLRQDGLISEYEFEQKRRQMLDRMV